MPIAKGRLDKTPWTGGISQFGKGLKSAFTLKESDNWVAGFDSTTAMIALSADVVDTTFPLRRRETRRNVGRTHLRFCAA